MRQESKNFCENTSIFSVKQGSEMRPEPAHLISGSDCTPGSDRIDHASLRGVGPVKRMSKPISIRPTDQTSIGRRPWWNRPAFRSIADERKAQFHSHICYARKARARDAQGGEASPRSAARRPERSGARSSPIARRPMRIRYVCDMGDAPVIVSRKGRLTRSHPRAKRPGLALNQSTKCHPPGRGCGAGEPYGSQYLLLANGSTGSSSEGGSGSNSSTMSVLGAFYFISTHNGSTDIVTNSDGVAVARFLYEPFGKVNTDLTDLDPDRNGIHYGETFLFTGQEFEPETGLYNYKARIL